MAQNFPCFVLNHGLCFLQVWCPAVFTSSGHHALLKCGLQGKCSKQYATLPLGILRGTSYLPTENRLLPNAVLPVQSEGISHTSEGLCGTGTLSPEPVFQDRPTHVHTRRTMLSTHLPMHTPEGLCLAPTYPCTHPKDYA